MEFRIINNDGMFNQELLHKYVRVIKPEKTIEGIIINVFNEIIAVQDQKDRQHIIYIQDVLNYRNRILVLGICIATTI